jgi:ribosomal protein S18 acetylase RimI-like enzyme
VLVHLLTAADQAWKVAALEAAWGSTAVARLGELVDAAPLPGFVVVDGDARVGLLTYSERADGIEVVTLEASVPGQGVGRALMNAVYDLAAVREATRLWLITTNENVRALAFYQRWGMDLRRLIRDGVAVSRQVKPTIPLVGPTGIPIRHELELERFVP